MCPCIYVCVCARACVMSHSSCVRGTCTHDSSHVLDTLTSAFPGAQRNQVLNRAICPVEQGGPDGASCSVELGAQYRKGVSLAGDLSRHSRFFASSLGQRRGLVHRRCCCCVRLFIGGGRERMHKESCPSLRDNGKRRVSFLDHFYKKTHGLVRRSSSVTFAGLLTFLPPKD